MSMLFGRGSDEDSVDLEKIKNINWNDHTNYKTIEEKVSFVSSILKKMGIFIPELILDGAAYKKLQDSLGSKFVDKIYVSNSVIMIKKQE